MRPHQPNPSPIGNVILAALLIILLLANLLWWIFAAPILVRAQAQAEDTVVCPAGEVTVIAGDGPANTPLLLVFAGRVVGGGAVGQDGRYQLTLTVGGEAPGRYPVAIERRGPGHQVLRELICVVPSAEELRAARARTATPTASPIPTAPPATPVPLPTQTPESVATPPPPAPTPTPTALDYSVPPAPPTPTPAPSAGGDVAVPGVVVEALPPLRAVATPTVARIAVPLTVRAVYDRNQNKAGDPDEGIAGLTVYALDSSGRVLAQGVTDQTGGVPLTVRVTPGATLTISVPHFAATQAVAAGAQPAPIVVAVVAPLPALLP
jgi:hypothetical protein